MGLLGGMMGTSVPLMLVEGRFLMPVREDDSANESQLRLSYPVYKGEQYTSSVNASYSQLNFKDKVTLDNGLSIPKSLFKTEAGTRISRTIEKGRVLGVQGSYGYAGDEFVPETSTYNIALTYSFPGNDGNWVLLGSISNNGIFGANVPVPGFFYLKKTKNFTGVFGLPIISMQWTPTHLWSFSASALGPNVSVEASRGKIEDGQAFLGSSFMQRRYLLSDRTNDRDRLVVEEKVLEAGWRMPLGKSIFTEVKGGLVFDRAVYVGESLFDRGGGEQDLKSAWMTAFSLRFLL